MPLDHLRGLMAELEPRNFLQPCLLLLLRARRPRLRPRGTAAPLHDGAGDAGGVYRALRGMERLGLVRSEWHASAVGPARRTYHVTPAGMECLEGQARELANVHVALHVFMDRYAALAERDRRSVHQEVTHDHHRPRITAGRGRPASVFARRTGPGAGSPLRPPRWPGRARRWPGGSPAAAGCSPPGAGRAAPDAAHVVVEFVHPVIVGNRALPALVLPDGGSAASVALFGEPGDILLALSPTVRRRSRRGAGRGPRARPAHRRAARRRTAATRPGGGAGPRRGRGLRRPARGAGGARHGVPRAVGAGARVPRRPGVPA